MKHWPVSALACTLLATALPAVARAEDAKPSPPASGTASATPNDGAAAKAPKKKEPAPAPAAPDNAPGAPAAPAAPAAPPDPNEDPRDRRIKELEDTVQQLLKRVEQLENKPAQPGTPAPDNAPPPATPTPPEPPAPTDTSARPSATYIPNISIVGEAGAALGDRSITEGRNRPYLRELEIAFQDAVSPSLRYDAFITAGGDDKFRLAIEEAFITATRLAPRLTARAGVIRVPFGKVNPLHTHSRFYIDEPKVIQAFLGPDGLRANGGVAEYLFPTRGYFLRGELGLWQRVSDTQDGFGFNGGGGSAPAYSGRIYYGREVGKDKELEIGASRFQGRGQLANNALGGHDLAVNGIDVTYRAFPGNDRRWIVQGEFLTHDTDEFAGGKTRLGAYLAAAYRWNQFWEGGMRLDWTQFPFPIRGDSKSGSLFLSKYITEQTSLRLQFTHGNEARTGDYNEILFQVLFGSGPHTHALQ